MSLACPDLSPLLVQLLPAIPGCVSPLRRPPVARRAGAAAASAAAAAPGDSLASETSGFSMPGFYMPACGATAALAAMHRAHGILSGCPEEDEEDGGEEHGSAGCYHGAGGACGGCGGCPFEGTSTPRRPVLTRLDIPGAHEPQVRAPAACMQPCAVGMHAWPKPCECVRSLCMQLCLW